MLMLVTNILIVVETWHSNFDISLESPIYVGFRYFSGTVSCVHRIFKQIMEPVHFVGIETNNPLN